MSSFNPSSQALGSTPVTPPAELGITTPEQEELYNAALEFERFFVKEMLKDVDVSAAAPGQDGEDGGSGSLGGYRDMAKDQLTQSVLDGGGLGLAASLYTDLADQAGLLPAVSPNKVDQNGGAS